MLLTSPAPDVSTVSTKVRWMDHAEVVNEVENLRKDQRAVIDFDETFFLRNSSQEYIRMVKPYFFGAIVYKCLEMLRPWNWFGSKEDGILTRDWFHVMAVTILFPWTWLLWNLRAKKMAEVWTNTALADVLKKRNPYNNVLCSQGFGPVVHPVLKHMGVEFGKVDTCRLFLGYSDRLFSKVKRVRGMIGETDLRLCAVVTDSEEDRELLEYSEMPLLVKWPVSPVSSITSHYIPFYYMYKVKHEGFAPILRDTLSVDLLLLILTFSWISPLPFVHVVGLMFFFLSFWLVYEIGYMENDEVAFQLEKDPVFGDKFSEKRDTISYVEPWFWVTLLAFLGSAFFLQIDALNELGITTFSLVSDSVHLKTTFEEVFFTQSQVIMAATWVAILVSMRYVYKFYNYTDKMTRTWIYPILQSYKTFAFMAISVTNLVGVVALFSQVAGRSFAYFLYRWGRKDWPGTELYMARFLLFIACLLFLVPAVGKSYTELFTFQAIVITMWISSRTVKPIARVLKSVKHISKDDWQKLKD